MTIARVTAVFSLICLIVCTAVSVSDAIADTSRDVDELLKKVSARFISSALTSADSFEEAAKTIGVEPKELTKLCTLLNIPNRFSPPPVKPVEITSAALLSNNNYVPQQILDYNGFSPYLILVDKKAHQLHLIHYEAGKRTLVKSFECKTGKNEGDKWVEGDSRTPEGTFFFVNRYSRKQIRGMVGKKQAYKYGDMAFVTNFPNTIDRMHGKNGGGIWLHGTDKPFNETSPNDTRGCVVTTNEDINTISTYIKLYQTPIVIVKELIMVKRNEIAPGRERILAMVESWRSAWASREISDYGLYYSKSFRSQGMNKKQWLSRKKAIFSAYSIKHIKLEHYSIFRHNSGLVVQFRQDYSASNIRKNVGIKTLYLMPEGETWEIVMEHFRKI